MAPPDRRSPGVMHFFLETCLDVILEIVSWLWVWRSLRGFLIWAGVLAAVLVATFLMT